MNKFKIVEIKNYVCTLFEDTLSRPHPSPFPPCPTVVDQGGHLFQQSVKIYNDFNARDLDKPKRFRSSTG